MLKRELSACNSVLDLGCGYNSPIQYCSVDFSVGVELFEPYLKESRKKLIHNQYVKADITRVEFKPKTFDAVTCLDVLEHLTKEVGQTLLGQMEKWAKNKVIVFTPNGYLSQDSYDRNPLQVHRSGWSIQELQKLGFKVFGSNGWKRLRGNKGELRYKPFFLWLTISELSQKMACRYPKLAFQLLCVKEVGEQ